MATTNAYDGSSGNASDSVISISTNDSKSNSKSNSRTRTLYLEPALPLPPEAVYDEQFMTNGMSCEGQFYDLASITDGTPYPAISTNPLRNTIVAYNYEVNVSYDAIVIDAIRDIEKLIFRDIAEASPLFVDGDTTEVICNKLLADALGIPYEDPNAGADPDDERVDDDDTPTTMSPDPNPVDDPDGRFSKLRRRNLNHIHIQNRNHHIRNRHHRIRNLQMNGGVNDDNDYSSILGVKAEPVDVIDYSIQCKSDPVPDTTCYSILGYTTVQTPVDNETIDEVGVEMQILQKIKKSMQENVYVSENVPSMAFIGIDGTAFGGENDNVDVAPGGGGTTGTDTTGETDFNRDEVFILPPEEKGDFLNDRVLTAFGISLMVALALSVGMFGALCGVRIKRRRERLSKRSKEKKFEQFQNDAIAMGEVEAMKPKQLLVAPSTDSVEIVDMDNPNTGGSSWSISCSDGLTSIGALMDSFRRTDDDGISASGTSNDKGAGIFDDDDLSVATKEYNDDRLLEDPPTPTRTRSVLEGFKK